MSAVYPLTFSRHLLERKAATMPTADMTVAEVLEKWPGTVSVFQELKTACVGCVMAPYDSLADVARIYDIELSGILSALQVAVSDE